MRRHLRRIFFWIFVALFSVTAVFITIYALGYRFSFERGIFIYTGSITLKSNPAVIDITIDNTPAIADVNRINNSYHIGGIRPGEHLVTVSAPDHQTWSKKVVVNSGISTEFWNIVLPRTQYPTTPYPSDHILKAFPSPESTLLAFSAVHGQEITVSTLETEEGVSEQIFSTVDFTFIPDDKENIEWSHDADYISIPVQDSTQREYFIVNTNTKSATRLSTLSTDNGIRAVRWDASRNNILFYLSDKDLYELNVENPAQKRLIAKNVQNYDISGDYLYVFELPSGIVHRVRIANPESRTQITTTAPSDLSDDRYSLIVYDEQRLALLNYYNGRLYIYNDGEKETYFTQLSSEARGAQFSDDGKKLLYWTDWEIFSYFTRKWEVQPVREENATLNMSRFSQHIKNVHWAKDYEHVIFSVGPEIKIIGLDQRGGHSLMNILTLSTAPLQVLSNFSENQLFYINTQQEEGRTNPVFQSIDFPETIGFLGFGS
jgi:hypothetical protein